MRQLGYKRINLMDSIVKRDAPNKWQNWAGGGIIVECD